MSPFSYNFTEIAEAYHAMDLPEQLAKYCEILLQKIIADVPLTVDERGSRVFR